MNGGADGYGGNGNGSNGHGHPRPEIPTAKIGMWLFAGSLAMIFAALAAWYGYRLADKPNYYFPWPPSLWVSTVAIVLSTLTLWLAQKNAKAGRMDSCRQWAWALTLALGWVFFLSQLVAWLLVTARRVLCFEQSDFGVVLRADCGSRISSACIGDCLADLSSFYYG